MRSMSANGVGGLVGAAALVDVAFDLVSDSAGATGSASLFGVEPLRPLLSPAMGEVWQTLGRRLGATRCFRRGKREFLATRLGW